MGSGWVVKERSGDAFKLAQKRCGIGCEEVEVNRRLAAGDHVFDFDDTNEPMDYAKCKSMTAKQQGICH